MNNTHNHSSNAARKWTTAFMWSLAFYYILLLNQHFNIPLRFIPWLLIFFAGAIFCFNKNINAGFCRKINILFSLQFIPAVFGSLAVLTICFVGASALQLPKLSSLYDLTTIYLGPIILGIIAIAFIPRNIKTVQFLCKACAYAILFLALTDTLHYVRDWYRMGHFADDSSHRWFGDGYIFFIPWLLLAYIKADKKINQLMWLFGIFWIFLLLSGTGSRGVMVVILIEITLFMSFYRRRPRAFLLPILLISAFALGAYLLAPQQIAGAIQRGALVQNRINDAWLPVFDFIRHSTWLGHGFGPAPWNEAYSLFLESHPGWPGINFGGPHNLLFDVAFIGGVLSLIAFIYLCFWIMVILFGMVRKSPFEIAGPALATLCSFIDFYLVRGLVESCRWEPLGVTLMWVILLSFMKDRVPNSAADAANGKSIQPLRVN